MLIIHPHLTNRFVATVCVISYAATVAVAFQSVIGGLLFFIEEFLHYTEQTAESVVLVMIAITTACWFDIMLLDPEPYFSHIKIDNVNFSW